MSDLLKVDRSTVARSVKKLEEKGLIKQGMTSTNRKNKEWFVTEKGEALYPFILAEHHYSENSALKGFSREEARELERLLIRVRKNITSDWDMVKKGQKRNYL